jgi:hypothetical protein
MDILFPLQMQNNECFCRSPPCFPTLVLNLKKIWKLFCFLHPLPSTSLNIKPLLAQTLLNEVLRHKLVTVLVFSFSKTLANLTKRIHVGVVTQASFCAVQNSRY